MASSIDSHIARARVVAIAAHSMICIPVIELPPSLCTPHTSPWELMVMIIEPSQHLSSSKQGSSANRSLPRDWDKNGPVFLIPSRPTTPTTPTSPSLSGFGLKIANVTAIGVCERGSGRASRSAKSCTVISVPQILTSGRRACFTATMAAMTAASSAFPASFMINTSILKDHTSLPEITTRSSGDMALVLRIMRSTLLVRSTFRSLSKPGSVAVRSEVPGVT
mmetsp:Transcript_10577/g.18169  ORF Transcript_10577/g.18169 Transcript_10577/m.18169 type:complete len:222 (+) Transcript_10577:161-826(+)